MDGPPQPDLGTILAAALRTWNDALFAELQAWPHVRPAHGAVMTAFFDRPTWRMADLVERSGLSLKTISQYVRELADAGILTVKADPEDRRRRHATLSAAGRRFVAAASERIAELERTVAQHVGPQRATRLTRDLMDATAALGRF